MAILNTNRINKLKLDKIIKGLSFIEEESKIEQVIDKVILFGSSITDYCTQGSDIDVCLVTNYDCKNKTFFNIFGRLPLVMDDSCDILIYSKLKGALKDEIDKKGVIVYESQ